MSALYGICAISGLFQFRSLGLAEPAELLLALEQAVAGHFFRGWQI